MGSLEVTIKVLFFVPYSTSVIRFLLMSFALISSLCSPSYNIPHQTLYKDNVINNKFDKDKNSLNSIRYRMFYQKCRF
jgi:hypothetical protein